MTAAAYLAEGARFTWGKTYTQRDADILNGLDAAPVSFFVGLASALTAVRAFPGETPWFENVQVHVTSRVRIGDTVSAEATIRRAEPSQGLYAFAVRFVDQRAATVGTGEFAVRVRPRPPRA